MSFEGISPESDSHSENTDIDFVNIHVFGWNEKAFIMITAALRESVFLFIFILDSLTRNQHI